MLNDFNAMLFLDTSQNMINQIKQKTSDCNIQNVDTLCFDFEKEGLSDLHADYIIMAHPATSNGKFFSEIKLERL